MRFLAAFIRRVWWPWRDISTVSCYCYGDHTILLETLRRGGAKARHTRALWSSFYTMDALNPAWSGAY